MVLFFKKRKTPALSAAEIQRLSKSERAKLAETLKIEGSQAWENEKNEEALEIYRQLIRLVPGDPELSRRIADCHQRLGNKPEELSARTRAATLYAEAGFLLKAVAMCKMALALDPAHRETLEKLAELNSHSRGDAPRPLGRAPSPPAAPATPAVDKAAALEEARARVAAVRTRRDEAARARAVQAPRVNSPPLAKIPSTSDLSPPSVALLDRTPLSLKMPPRSVGPKSVAQPNSGQPSLHSISPDEDVEIYIAPLDFDDLDLQPEELGAVDAFDQQENREEDNAEEMARADDETERDAVASALGRTPLLSDLKEETFIRLIQKVKRMKIEKGQVLFEAGSPADAMYVVVEGEVVARTEGPLELDLATMKEGDFFGEIGLLAQEPRQATIVALKDTELLVFEQDILDSLQESEPDFVRILLRFVRERLVASLIAKNPLFAAFSDEEAQELTRRFQFLEVGPRKALVHQGEKSEGLFLLLTGSAEVVCTQDGQTKTLGQLGPGEIFGEMSLLNREPAMASVITETKAYALRLPGSDFTQMVMMHPALLDYVSGLATRRESENQRGPSAEPDFREDWLPLL